MKDVQVSPFIYHSMQALSVSLLFVICPPLIAHPSTQIALKGYHQCLPWSDDPPDEDPTRSGHDLEERPENPLSHLFDDARVPSAIVNDVATVDEMASDPRDDVSCDLYLPMASEVFDSSALNCVHIVCVVFDPDSMYLMAPGWILVDVSDERLELLRSIAAQQGL